MSRTHHEDPAPGARAAGHEPDRVAVGTILWSIAALVFLLVAAVSLPAWLFNFESETVQRAAESQETGDDLRSRTPFVAEDEHQNAPDVTTDQRLQLASLHQRESRQLEQYEWVDARQGLVRIPVKRAMEILAETGFPEAELPGEPPTVSSEQKEAADAPAAQ